MFVPVHSAIGHQSSFLEGGMNASFSTRESQLRIRGFYFSFLLLTHHITVPGRVRLSGKI